MAQVKPTTMTVNREVLIATLYRDDNGNWFCQVRFPDTSIRWTTTFDNPAEALAEAAALRDGDK